MPAGQAPQAWDRHDSRCDTGDCNRRDPWAWHILRPGISITQPLSAQLTTRVCESGSRPPAGAARPERKLSQTWARVRSRFLIPHELWRNCARPRRRRMAGYCNRRLWLVGIPCTPLASATQPPPTGCKFSCVSRQAPLGIALRALRALQPGRLWCLRIERQPFALAGFLDPIPQ